MHDSTGSRREAALAIWQAGVDAVLPRVLVPRALADAGMAQAIAEAPRILVVGAGKAGAAMSEALVQSLSEHSERISGLVNVPNETVRLLPAAIVLHGARPMSSNHPTESGVAGARRILEIAGSAGKQDVGIVLLSGGGSALLPAPCTSITLAEKQRVTLLLHACGASIGEMNAVRKHLSAIKGGRLAQAFTGRMLFSLILSDVVGDPLDVIASGPTVADPSTFADSLNVLRKFGLLTAKANDSGSCAPRGVIEYLEKGAAGLHPETPKQMPPNVHNRIIGNNSLALDTAARQAASLGFHVHSLGSAIEGDTAAAAKSHADTIRELLAAQGPEARPICLLSGGETTVNLGSTKGKGGRNQEFALTLLVHLGPDVLSRTTILAAGTDGEDGPTDAAGAIVDEATWEQAVQTGLDAKTALAAHDSYPFLDRTGSLLRTGLTQTNVMDLRVILLFPALIGTS